MIGSRLCGTTRKSVSEKHRNFADSRLDRCDQDPASISSLDLLGGCRLNEELDSLSKGVPDVLHGVHPARYFRIRA